MEHAFAICHPGLEFSCVAELKDKIGVASEPVADEGIVRFSAPMQKVLEFCYLTQSCHKVLLALHEGTVSDIEDIEKIRLTVPFGKKRFLVQAKRIGDHLFTSRDVEHALGENIDMKVDFDNPEVILLAYIHGKHIVIGVDLAGFDLAKREYKVFSSQNSLKANVAFAIAQYFQPKKIVLDPFCGDGTIVIEAALLASRFPCHYYSKNNFAFRNIAEFDFAAVDARRSDALLDLIGYDTNLNTMKYAQKNSKLAGINKLVTISRVDVEWLDWKFGKNAIDLVIGCPPFVSKTKPEKEIAKTYDQLFDNCAYILKKNGKVALLARSPGLLIEAAEKHKFSCTRGALFVTGDISYQILEFSKTA